MKIKVFRVVSLITTFVFCLFMMLGCASAQTERTNKVAVEPMTQPTNNSTSANRSDKVPETEGKRLKLSEQPLEIRLFFAPDYNLIEDEKTGSYPDKSPKWAQFIETEVREVDLDHDGLPERMIIFLTDPFGREINPETFDVYFFRLEKGKWKVMNRKSFNHPDQIRFVNAPKQGDFDEIRYSDTRENPDKPDDTATKIISVQRFLNGEYKEVECRNSITDEIISNCPPQKTANDY